MSREGNLPRRARAGPTVGQQDLAAHEHCLQIAEAEGLIRLDNFRCAHVLVFRETCTINAQSSRTGGRCVPGATLSRLPRRSSPRTRPPLWQLTTSRDVVKKDGLICVDG